MDLSGAVLNFATGTYTVTRPVARANPVGTDGRYDAPSSSTTFTIRAGVFPLTGRELDRLPEGLRHEEVRQVFCVERLQTVEADQEPDVIAIDGASWQVEAVQDYSASGNYFRALVRKIP